MSLTDAIARILSDSDEPAVDETVDLSSSPEARLALLRRSQEGAASSPAPETPVDHHFDDGDDSAAFARTMARRHGVDLDDDDASLDAVDAVIDGMRIRGERFDPTTRRQAVAWIAEWSRHARGLARDAYGIITDGRVAYDPARRIDDRLVSADAPTLAQSMDRAISTMGARTLAAA